MEKATHRIKICSFVHVDSCQVKNGGCDPNAVCSHERKTNEVACTCKTGYTNTSPTSTVVCTGKLDRLISISTIFSSSNVF